MKPILLVFLALLPLSLLAQEISGRVVAADGGEALSYVNIGILNKSTGTVSDEWGNFSLDLSEVAATDTLRFSLIGYEMMDYRVGKFKQECQSDCSVSLKAKDYTLTEILVTPKDYKERIIGNRIKSKRMQAGFQTNALGHEMGTLMKIKKKPAFIQEVYLNIGRCEYDSIFYRLNIYKVENKRPGETLLKEPIYLSYAKEDLVEELVIDLRHHYLYVEDHFLVTVEIVKDLGEQGLYFKAGIFNNKSYFRHTSQSKWGTVPIGIGIAAKIKQER